MASKVSSVIVRFRGDTRQLDKSVKGAEKRLTTMGKLGRTANLALAAGVAAAGTIIFSAAKQFDEAQGVIRNATGKTGEELKGLTDQLKAVTANSTQATTELAGAIGTIDTLFDGTDKQVGSLTETLADFARVAGGSLETQADSLGKIAAAYGESIGDTERALDTFVKVTADYAIGGDDLMTQLLKHGPTLQAFGLGMEESAVALGKLNAAGVQIRQWSSGVRVMLGYFLDAGLEPRKAMESLNQELLTASSRTEQLGLLSKWMDETAAVQYINAICAGVDVTADFTEEIEGATGAMDTMGGWDNMTLQQKIDEVKNKFISIGSDIADHIMPCLNKVADWLGEEGNIQIALGVIGGLFAVTLVAKVGTFIASIGRIGAALAAAATSPGLLLFMKAMAPILIIAGAIHALQKTFDAYLTPEPERDEGQQRIVDRLTGRGYFLGAPKPGEERPSYEHVEVPLAPQWPQGPAPMVPGAEQASGVRERRRRTGVGFPYPQGTWVPPEPPPYLETLPKVPVRMPPGLQPTPGLERRSTWPDRPPTEPGAGSPIHPFAEGGIVREPTIGLVGEAGPEAVVPLDEVEPQVIINVAVYPQNVLGTEDDLLRHVQEGLNEAYRKNPAGNFRFAPAKRR